MNIERIRFGISSIYRPNAITRLVREEKSLLTDEAITFDGEKRQARDQEHPSKEQGAQSDSEKAAVVASDAKVEAAPLDVVA
ncbi:MAG: hypothetical protein J0M12_11095 [Deltaproteobacteria bacterium]|nr:hypothetical protein [Deltaproteobacteria bacterium]